MYHSHLANGSLVDPPSPTRSKKRKRSEAEEDIITPTKTRSRLVSSQSFGLPTPDGKGGPLLPTDESQPMGANSHSRSYNLVSVTAGTFVFDTEGNKDQFYSQKMTPPSSVTPSAPPNLPGLQESSPSRTRASSRSNVPFSHLMLSIPHFLIQPPSSPLHITSLEASVLALRRILTLHTSNQPSQVLTLEQECYAWIMFSELGLQIINSLSQLPDVDSLPGTTAATSIIMSPVKLRSLKSISIPSWAPNPGEIETAISRALRLADQVASLRPLRHNLTMIHSQLVCLQENHKHARVLLKRLLPLSTNTQPIPREKIWSSYEAHLAITNQILTTPLSNSPTIDVPAALSQLNALFMLANQYGDHALVQLISVTRLTTLFQNYEFSDSISSTDVDNALQEAEAILGLDGFDKQTSAAAAKPTAANGSSSEGLKAINTTPGAKLADNGDQIVTPFIGDVLAGSGTTVVANLKTPAFCFPINPLGMNVYSAEQLQTENADTTVEEGGHKLIPPYLRYLRVQTLMLGVLWLTHSGESTRSSERLTLLHEMMDKLNDLSKTEGWASDNESGLIIIPLYSNPERSLRIQATHPRVLYQVTFMISAIAKRDCLGRKPKRKVFAQEGLRISSGDDPRDGVGPKNALLDGGSAFDFAPGLGLRDLRNAQQSIADIRATAYYELVSACLIRSEFEEAEQNLTDLVSFVRATSVLQSFQPSMWDQYASRITLLYAHLAHARGRSKRALQCYQTVCLLEEDEQSMLWTMGKVGEIVLRIGATAIRAEEHGAENDESADDSKQEQQIWRSGERERLVDVASGVVDRCLNGGLGEHMAVVGRVIAASLSAEIVRAKQNLKSGLDLASKSRDNYLRLLVLIFTAGQYLYTHTDYALTILETCRQLASSLGAVTAPPVKETPHDGRRSTRSAAVDERPQYHVGHARAGLWIGQRFAEISKRRGASDKAAKQNAINMVFQKAVDAIEQQAGGNTGPRIHDILDEFPLHIPSTHTLATEPEHPRPTKAPVPLISKSQSRNPANRSKPEDTRASEESRETSPSYPPSSDVSERTHRSKRSDTSFSRSSIGGHSQNRSVTSTASRRSTRTRGERKVIIESDDEGSGRKVMSEDEFKGSEFEDSDAEVQL